MTPPASPSSWSAIGPLAKHPRRRIVATAVRHGQAVDNPDDAAAAIAQATWANGNYELGGIVALVVGILAIVSGDAGWLSMAAGGVFVIVALTCLGLMVNARRAVAFNQELRGSGQE
jgi:hypothetical protein